MTSDITYRKIWDISYPIMLGSLAQNILNVTDTAFLGRVGNIELGAAAIGGVFYFALIMIGWGFGIGTQIIMARRLGEGKLKEIGRTHEHALLFLIPISFLVLWIVQLYSSLAFTLWLKSENIYHATMEFINYRIYGLPFAFIVISFNSFYTGTTRTSVITKATVLISTVNIISGYILVFGKFGFPALGIKGAAMASVFAEASGCLFYFLYTIYKTPFKDYGLFQFQKFKPELFYRIVKISTPTMFQNFFSFSVWFFFFLIVENMGEKALAISNILRSIYIFMLMPMSGFGSAANTLVSYSLGRQNVNIVPKVIMKTMILCLGCVFIIVIITLLFPSTIIHIYTNDLSLVSGTLPLIKIICLASFFLAGAFVLFNGVSGTGKTQVSFVIEILTLSLYLTGVYVASIHHSLEGVWMNEFLYGLLIGLFSLLYLKLGKWQKSNI